MRRVRCVGAVAAGLVLAACVVVPGARAAEAGLSDYQGAWLAQGPACADVFAAAGKGTTFRKPVDIFAPAFIIAGNRLRTPSASCRVKSLRPSGNHQVLALDCATTISAADVKVLVATLPDGTLRRYFNDQDNVGTGYQKCSP
jgi:hypothetical protein